MGGMNFLKLILIREMIKFMGVKIQKWVFVVFFPLRTFDQRGFEYISGRPPVLGCL